MKQQQRRLLPAPSAPDTEFEFRADGRALYVRRGTSRPFAHVLANSFGQGAVLTNDGDIFSFSGNARQNSLTPFRMGEGRAGPSGQAIYVRDMSSGDTDCATFLPLRRMDGTYDCGIRPRLRCLSPRSATTSRSK